ncbi:MAG: phytoene desaturase, partial [Pseudomonadota bacterium]
MLTLTGLTRPAVDRAGPPRAVVIGSGFGGLAAAIRLGARGYRVTVLEKLDAPGGRAYVHRQDGYTFDAGPTVITAPFLFEELWSLCGKRMADDVELRPVTPFYHLRYDDGSTFDYHADPAAMDAEIARLAPGDVAGFRTYMRESEAIYKVGFEQLGHMPFDTVGDMLRVAPDMLRLQSWRTVYGFVAKYIKDERLRIALSFHPLLVGGNPFTTTSVYCLIDFLERRHGVYWAMGGTGSLVKGLVGLIDGQGGRIEYGAEVEQILVRDGTAVGVRCTDGSVQEAEVVVSNADSAWTYSRLLPASARKRWTDRKLARAKYSMSLFVWYFGTTRQWPEVPHHSILLGPRFRELLDDIFDRKVLAPDFSLDLHRPTATDPSMAPAGCDAFYALVPVPHLDSGVDWATHAETFRQRIAERLESTVMPGFSRHVVTSRLLTPQDFHDRLLSYKGAAFGLEPTLLQSAWFRPHNRSEEVERLFLVGAGTHPGAGLPGVISSAKVLDEVV